MKAFWQEFKHHKLAVVGAAIMLLFAVIAIAAPLLSPHDPYAVNAEAMLQDPGASYWFGTDQLGRDIFSRLLYGARISFQVGAIAVTIALVAGSFMGVLAGYFGGWLDFTLSRITDVLFAFPDILLALAIMAILGPQLTNVMLAVGIVYTPIFARLARGATLSVKESTYVEAARAMGVNNGLIMWRHIVPNILAPLIVQTTLSFAFAILAEAALSFLGLGVEPDTPSWGIMLSEGKDWMERAWWTAVFPGVAITIAVLSLNLIGDGLRDTLDPRMKS